MPAPLHATKIRVMLVEDDVNFQNDLIAAIQITSDIHVIETANSRAQAFQILAAAQIDVLLVDLGLPDGSGIDVIKAAHAKLPQCNIMVSTAFGDELHVMQSLEAGASGYLLKDSEPAHIVSEIRTIHQGGSPISPLIARQILQRFHKKNIISSAAAQNLAVLSTREQEVLEHVTRGFTTDEIAALIGVSRHTVLTYIRRIYAKLNVNSKAEAIYEAHNRGLLNG